MPYPFPMGDMSPLTPADLPALRRLAEFLDRQHRIAPGVLAAGGQAGHPPTGGQRAHF